VLPLKLTPKLKSMLTLRLKLKLRPKLKPKLKLRLKPKLLLLQLQKASKRKRLPTPLRSIKLLPLLPQLMLLFHLKSHGLR
jgi:hypothetical protein